MLGWWALIFNVACTYILAVLDESLSWLECEIMATEIELCQMRVNETNVDSCYRPISGSVHNRPASLRQNDATLFLDSTLYHYFMVLQTAWSDPWYLDMRFMKVKEAKLISSNFVSFITMNFMFNYPCIILDQVSAVLTMLCSISRLYNFFPLWPLWHLHKLPYSISRVYWTKQRRSYHLCQKTASSRTHKHSRQHSNA